MLGGAGDRVSSADGTRDFHAIAIPFVGEARRAGGIGGQGVALPFRDQGARAGGGDGGRGRHIAQRGIKELLDAVG